MLLLSQNAKMKKTAKTTGVQVYNFGMPAFRSASGFITCPMARDCISGCYARCGTFLFKSTKSAYERRLEATFRDDFHKVMSAEIKLRQMNLKQGETMAIRIHDSADFYDESYLKKWILVMIENPSVQFYAYTKSVSMMKAARLPTNFTTIFSYGGKEDHLINPETDRHAVVFENVEELNNAGYANATDNDLIASNGVSIRIGLVYHGKKNYDNTRWSEVVW